MWISRLSLCCRSRGKGQGELWVLSTVPRHACQSWCLAGAQTCPLGRSKAKRRCRMAQAAEARHGEDVVWEELQPSPCLESSPKAAEPCRLRWNKLLWSWRGAHGAAALGSSICLPWGRAGGYPQPTAGWQGSATLLPPPVLPCSLGKACGSVCAPAATSTVPPFPELWQGAVSCAGAQPCPGPSSTSSQAISVTRSHPSPWPRRPDISLGHQKTCGVS